ncbi:hypothetical protein [Kitasatospora terrestris]|uniref:NERD domain-containing protein n=1 Tax=Kitasatospora terrestris TaxID=258051 RepID=A0ABP9DIV5_9ACTN
MQKQPPLGTRIEELTRHLAGVFGLPDFVYLPKVVSHGPGVRELSDGLLVVGNRGLILQSKSRRPGDRPDSVEKAKRWCLKEGRSGQRQGAGTRRTMREQMEPFMSVRGYERMLPDPSSWPTVVIIWHPDNPAVEFPAAPDTMFIALNDWLHLHAMVRSTTGVIAYVERALASGISVPLGCEQDRYQALAGGDLRASFGMPGTVPGLPPFFPDDRTLRLAALFESLMDHAAKEADRVGTETYLRIVEALDRTPTEPESTDLILE